MSPTQWRFALGACVLSAVLLVGSAGEGTAAADPETGGSTADSQRVDSSSQDVSSATGPGESTAVTESSDSPGNSSHKQSAGSQGPMTLGATTTDPQESAPAGSNEAVATVANSEGSGSTTTVTTQLASDPVVVESRSAVVVPPPTTVVTSRSMAAAPTVVDPRVALRTDFAPVVHAVANTASAVAVFPGMVAKLPTSPTPVTDVITAIQNMLTSVGAVGVSLAQMPSDLAFLLGFPVMDPGAIAGVFTGGIGRSLHGARPSVAAAPAWGGSGLSQLLMNSGMGVSSPSSVLWHTTLSAVKTTGLSQDLSVSGVAPVATDAVASGVMESFLEHTVSAVLVPASLTALAALALPGLGGLLIICATGMLVGYRQAKAAVALRAVGIARFARRGPLGVVRSGSQIALHYRAPHTDRRRPSGSARALKLVA
jgi:hypothetical protein